MVDHFWRKMIRSRCNEFFHSGVEFPATRQLVRAKASVASLQEFLEGDVSEQHIDCLIGAGLFRSKAEPSSALLPFVGKTGYDIDHHLSPSLYISHRLNLIVGER
jgi:hypothetical protein